MEVDEALRIARRHLAQLRTGLPLVITKVEAFPHGWVMYYDSESYRRTGKLEDSVSGNAPFIVDRLSGKITVTRTNRSVQQQIDEYIAARTSPPGGSTQS